VIPEIDIWRIANLMLKCYGDEADIESAIRAKELFEEGDHNGAAIWWRVIDANCAAIEHDTVGTSALTG